MKGMIKPKYRKMRIIRINKKMKKTIAMEIKRIRKQIIIIIERNQVLFLERVVKILMEAIVSVI